MILQGESMSEVEYRGVTYDADTEIGTSTAALIADVNRRTILNWCRQGYLPSTQRPGPRGQYLIVIKDLIDVLTKPGVKELV